MRSNLNKPIGNWTRANDSKWIWLLNKNPFYYELEIQTFSNSFNGEPIFIVNLRKYKNRKLIDGIILENTDIFSKASKSAIEYMRKHQK